MMITEWFLGLYRVVADWFINLFPAWTPPTEFVNLDKTLNDFIATFSGMGAWIPWDLLFVCLGISLGVWLTGLTIKFVRAIAAHIPAFGGAG